MIESNGYIPTYLNHKINALVDWFIIYKNLPDQERSKLVKQSYDELSDFFKSDEFDCTQEEKEKMIEEWYAEDKNRLHDSRKFISNEFLNHIMKRLKQ